MYDFITLTVKCPNCGTLLMDQSKLVDNNPSIKLNIEIGGKTGSIWLSSIYGSYNYVCDIDSPINEIAHFSCTHCNSEIVSEKSCNSCNAPMIPFHLKMGGVVSICSRSGCKNHFVEFEDLEVAMKQLHQEYEIRGNHEPLRPPIKDIPKKVIDEELEIIKSGSFLQTYCPHCRKSLIEKDKLKLMVRNGGEGLLYLSPYLNVFTTMSTIFLPEDKTVTDLSCPHCNESLMITEKKCDACNSSVAKILVGARTKMIDFYLCSKKGCKWHGLEENDLNDIRLEDSLEW